MFRVVLITILIAGSSCQVNEGLREYIQEILDNVGPALRVGIPEARVPPLDPFVPGTDTNFDQNKGGAKVNGNVRDIRIEGISNFKAVISNVDVNGLDVQARATINIPNLKVTGNYNLDGRAFAVIPIRGNGGLRLETHGIRGQLDLAIKVDATNEILEARNVRVSVDFDRVDANFENLINAKLSQLLNNMISFLAKPLFDKVLKEKLDSQFSEQLTKIVNKKLKDVKFDKIKDLIAG